MNVILAVFLIIIIMASRTLTVVLMFSITIIVSVLYIIASVISIRNVNSKENNMQVYLEEKRKATRKCNFHNSQYTGGAGARHESHTDVAKGRDQDRYEKRHTEAGNACVGGLRADVEKVQ